MRRALLSLRDEAGGLVADGAGDVLGAVVLVGGEARWEGLAGDVFRSLRLRRGDDAGLARDLLAQGWSNGQTLVLGPLTD